MTILQHWGEHQKVKEKEEDQTPLGGLLRKRETRLGGRVLAQNRGCALENVTALWAYRHNENC